MTTSQEEKHSPAVLSLSVFAFFLGICAGWKVQSTYQFSVTPQLAMIAASNQIGGHVLFNVTRASYRSQSSQLSTYAPLLFSMGMPFGIFIHGLINGAPQCYNDPPKYCPSADVAGIYL